MRAPVRSAIGLAAAALLCAGCSGPSVTGTWSGKVRGAPSGGVMGALAAQIGEATVGGKCVLVLNRGGEAFLKLGPMPETPATWRQDGSKVVVSLPDSTARATSSGALVSPIVGTLSADGKLLVLDLGPVEAALARER